MVKRNVDRYGGIRDGYTIRNMVEEDVPMNLYEYRQIADDFNGESNINNFNDYFYWY